MSLQQRSCRRNSACALFVLTAGTTLTLKAAWTRSSNNVEVIIWHGCIWRDGVGNWIITWQIEALHHITQRDSTALPAALWGCTEAPRYSELNANISRPVTTLAHRRLGRLMLWSSQRQGIEFPRWYAQRGEGKMASLHMELKWRRKTVHEITDAGIFYL